jgi:hypothetical protein
VHGSGSTSTVLLIADPGAPAKLVDDIADSLADEITQRADASMSWEVATRAEPYLPDEQAPIDTIIESVNPASESAEVVVYVTDLPRRDHTVPIVADISPRHRFALVSIPGVGGAFLLRRLREVLLLAIAQITEMPELAGDRPKHLPRKMFRDGIRYFAPKGMRRLRLLAGMVRANRPWRLVTGLSKVLVGAFASGAIGLVTITIWELSDTMGPWRMAGGTVLSITAMVAWLILDHELWERPDSPTQRDRARLYNAATLVTLLLGVAVLHVALFLMLLATAGLMLPPTLLEKTIGHPITITDYLALAWLTASIATVGGALGSGLEDDDAVRVAAYGVRQRERFDKTIR